LKVETRYKTHMFICYAQAIGLS